LNFCERLQDYYLRRAKTDNGDNDTSVQNARPAGIPAEVRFLWWRLVTVSL